MKKIFLLAAATLALTACEKNDDNPVTSPIAARITATIGESTLTRACDTIWAAGDQIGINSTTGTEAGPYKNLKYTTTDGSGNFTGDTLMYFYNPLTLTAYYPFAGTEGTVQGIIETNTAAVNQAQDKQQRIDYLYAGSTGINIVGGVPEINFRFAHKMSKLTFIFVNDDIETTDISQIVSYEIEGLVMVGSFNPATGECAIKEGAGAQNLKIDLQKGTVESGKSVAPLILLPQKPGRDAVKLHLYLDEVNNDQYLQTYTCPLTFGEGELAPGKNYQYTIKVSKTGMEVKQMGIADWIETPMEGNAVSSD